MKLHPKATHLDDVGIHPNGYFEASMIYHSKDGQMGSGKKQMNSNRKNLGLSTPNTAAPSTVVSSMNSRNPSPSKGPNALFGFGSSQKGNGSGYKA